MIAILGFAVAAILAWAFEASPEGLNRDPQDAACDGPGVAAPLADIIACRSVSVLPFLDMSTGKDQGYFCDGVADEILGLLSTVICLHAISRTSSFRFKGKNLGIRGQRLAALRQGELQVAPH